MNRKRIALVAVAVFVVLMVLVTVLGLTKQSAAGVCQNFIKAAAASDATKSYALFSSTAKAQTSATDWQQTVQGLVEGYGSKPELQKLSDTETPATKTQPYNGTVKYKVYGKLTQYEATCNMVQENKHYLVDSFVSNYAQ